MEDLTCSWSPKLIVDLIKSIAWPVVVLLIGLSFRIRIFELARSFFSKNTVSEISASASGFSAKFITEKQSIEVLETSNSNVVNLPKHMSIEAIRETHEQQKTEFSEEVFQVIIKHASSLDIDNEEKIELLAREVSISQSTVRYFEINKVLFRSQYNLFCKIASNNGYIRAEDALNYFHGVKSNNKEALAGWDWIKYVSYPVSNGLICENDNGFKLTPLGRSHVAFMSNRPQLIDELAKL
ncbi:hypothetical protein ABK864_03555 [Serratia marcescens]|uniref:hypothetical protein n=1 Tax=Serratia TaxID=613 RepID=UPI00313B8493